MCKMVFIGTNSKLKEIPFDKTKVDFNIESITDEFKGIRRHFKTENVYFVATSEGCGCRFVYQTK